MATCVNGPSALSKHLKVNKAFDCIALVIFWGGWRAGQAAEVRHISLRGLLPETDYYMTYEGSTTHPGCWETTTWIVFNKPIYVTRQEVSLTLFFLVLSDRQRLSFLIRGHKSHLLCSMAPLFQKAIKGRNRMKECCLQKYFGSHQKDFQKCHKV